MAVQKPKKPFISGQTGNLANERQIQERFKGVNETPIRSMRQIELDKTKQIQDAFVRQAELIQEQALQNEIQRQRNQEEATRVIIEENKQSPEFRQIQENFQPTETPTQETPQTTNQIDPLLQSGSVQPITSTDLGLAAVGAAATPAVVGAAGNVIKGAAPALSSIANFQVADLSFTKNLLSIKNILGLGVLTVGGDIARRIYKKTVTPELNQAFDSDDNIIDGASKAFSDYDQALTQIKKVSDLGNPVLASRRLKELRGTVVIYESKLQNAINTSDKVRGNSEISIELMTDLKNLNDEMDSMEQYITNSALIPRSQQFKNQLSQQINP